jgi:hypothetical protein
LSLDSGLFLIGIPTALSIANAIILAYNLKLTRDSNQLSKWVDVLQHSNLLVKLEGTTEIQLAITNVGDIPIDEVEVIIEGKVTKGNSNLIFTKSYKSNTVINQKETSTIPLYKDLEPFLLSSKLIGNHYEELPTGEIDPYTGEETSYNEKYTHIFEEFIIDFSIKIQYSVNKAVKSIPKVIRAHYDYIEEFNDPRYGDSECRYSDNFTIRFEEVQWTSI